jgi:hypothetical protein
MTEATNFQVNYSCVVTIDKPEIETLSPFYSGTHISQSLGEIAANMPNVELAKQIRASQPVLSKYSFIPNGQSKVPA